MMVEREYLELHGTTQTVDWPSLAGFGDDPLIEASWEDENDVDTFQEQ